ncbi:S8 family peptidase [Patescibacteria group bacterium]|nr:S8 family peptidase [Patescibacteria group bacterium]
MKLNKKLLSIFTSLFLVTLFIASASCSSKPVSAQSENSNDHVPGQVLVKFKDGTPQGIIDATMRGNNSTVRSKIVDLNVLVLKVPQAAEEKVAFALSHNPNVEYAELDYMAQALMTVDDPYFSTQWGLENTNDADIDAPAAWDITKGNETIVAILDSGVSKNHPDVSAQVVVDRANYSDSATDDDVYGHGTHVGGIVAAMTNNGVGVAGVCPDCKLMSVKVLNDSGSGAYSWIANGITYAANHGAKVINMSLGGSRKSITLENAVNYAWNKDVVVVAAAGNSGNQSKTYPGAYTNAIAVAATDNQDKKASFSEYGSWVDVAAPGVSIYSSWNDNSSPSNPQPDCISATECYKYASGTSMSTPMTAGVVALIWSTNKYTTASQVRNRLEVTADKIAGTGTYWSAGRVNAFNAVDGNYILPTPTPTPTPKPGRNR